MNNKQIELSLHAFNQWAFCPYRFWLIYRCGEMEYNQHVYRGLRHHRRVDRPSQQGPEDAPIVRSMRVYHKTLGLMGVIDLLDRDHEGHPIPVETKAGKCREKPWPNDILQVTAQAICLEDTLKQEVQTGIVFYAGSRKRIAFPIQPSYRKQVESACTQMRAILTGESQPSPVYKPRCEGCSLFDVCLPQAKQWLTFEEVS